jgi:hypothetical protein
MGMLVTFAPSDAPDAGDAMATACVVKVVMGVMVLVVCALGREAEGTYTK